MSEGLELGCEVSCGGGWLPVDHPHLTASLLQPYPGPMGAQPVSYLDHDSGQDTEAVEALD